jgi:hypothetical protein
MVRFNMQEFYGNNLISASRTGELESLLADAGQLLHER